MFGRRYSVDSFRALIFSLCYRAGGSGLGFSYQDAMLMPLDDLDAFHEMLEEQRFKERDAANRARSKAGK